MVDNSGGHVKFSEGTHLETGAINVDKGSAYHLPEAHIGMLKNHHTYHAEFPVKHDLGKDISVSEPNYNLYVRTIEKGPVNEEEEGGFVMTIKVQIKTIKEGRIREKILLSGSNNREMEVLVTAQVMGSDHGHPLLKDGVHIVSHDIEDESDWPGHSSH